MCIIMIGIYKINYLGTQTYAEKSKESLEVDRFERVH